MNILDLPDIITFKIFYFLGIINLVKISEVCKKFNRYAKDFNIKDQQETIDCIFGFNYILNNTFFLELDNRFMAYHWSNILFCTKLDYRKEKEKSILHEKNPSNLLFSVKGVELIEMEKIHESIKYLHCPHKIIKSKENGISKNLYFLNMSEQLHIPEATNFRSPTLRYLDLSFSDLLNINLNFCKNLKTVNMMGVTNFYSLVGFENIENLNIDYCDEIKDLTPLKKIKNLSMRYCQGIEEIPFLNTLRYLDISHSNVKDITKTTNLKGIYFEGLVNLNLHLHNYSYLQI